MSEFKETSAGRLRKRLFFYLAGAMLLLVLGLTALVSLSALDHIRDDLARNLAHSAEIRSLALGEWCQRSKDVAGQITTRSRIRQELGKYVEGKISLEELDAFTRPKLEDAMNLSSEILGIIRLDVDGHAVSRCGHGPPGKDRDLGAYVSDEARVSDPLLIGGRQAMVVSAPIISRGGKRLGTDLVSVDVENLRDVVTDPSEEGTTCQVVVAYRSGHGLSPLFPTAALPSASQPEPVPFQSIEEQLRLAVEGETGDAVLAKHSVAYHPVTRCGWGLAVARTRGELREALYGAFLRLVGVSMLVYFVILFGFWFATKPLAGRILLHSDELERRIREKTASLEAEVVVRKRAEEEKGEKIAELRAAMEQIKVLSGMLPICSNCKKVRDDEGYWKQIEHYIADHSDAEFTHGLCPDCSRTLYPDLDVED